MHVHCVVVDKNQLLYQCMASEGILEMKTTSWSQNCYGYRKSECYRLCTVSFVKLITAALGREAWGEHED